MSWLRLVLLALGVALLIGLVVGHDPAAVFASLRQLSWRFVVILLFPAIPVMVFDTLGWRFTLPRAARTDAFDAMFGMRLAGDAINYLTPTAAMGGELVRYRLLSRSHPPARWRESRRGSPPRRSAPTRSSPRRAARCAAIACRRAGSMPPPAS